MTSAIGKVVSQWGCTSGTSGDDVVDTGSRDNTEPSSATAIVAGTDISDDGAGGGSGTPTDNQALPGAP